MEQCLKFVVLGEPQGKARPRFARRGQYVSTYTPKETKSYEALVRYCAASARQKEKTKPISADMSLFIKAYFKVLNQIQISGGTIAYLVLKAPVKNPIATISQR